MKSFTSSQKTAFVPSSAENNSPELTPETTVDKLEDQRKEAAVQRQQMQEIDQGPLMISQLMRQQNFPHGPIQKMDGLDEEELEGGSMQGKFSIQKKDDLEEELEGDPMQGKFSIQKKGDLEEELEGDSMQGKFTPTTAPIQRAGNSTGMPDEVKTKMESSMGADFSNVNIHSNSAQAPAVGALAYAQGNDIHFAPGQFKPESTSGQQLLGHELAHVVQQREGRVKPNTEVNGMPVNNDPKLENEADQMGRKAAQHKKKR